MFYHFLAQALVRGLSVVICTQRKRPAAPTHLKAAKAATLARPVLEYLAAVCACGASIGCLVQIRWVSAHPSSGYLAATSAWLSGAVGVSAAGALRVAALVHSATDHVECCRAGERKDERRSDGQHPRHGDRSCPLDDYSGRGATNEASDCPCPQHLLPRLPLRFLR